jgi:hypothetical protein
MEHLITNLVVPKLNLTCLREMEQHLHDKVQHIKLLAALCTHSHDNILLDPHHILYVHRCHIVINPLLEITSQRFQWRWKEAT